MAKKEKLVDLKPEKVTPSQLEKIQKAVSNINRAQMEIGRLETQKHNLSHQIAGLQDELKLIQDSIQKKGMTCILRKLYWKNNLVKGDISIGKGKKTFDLREDIKQRDWKREKARVLKNSSKAK